MTRLKSPASAEHLNLEETQDSQAVLAALKAELGVGTQNQSTPHDETSNNDVRRDNYTARGYRPNPNVGREASKAQPRSRTRLRELDDAVIVESSPPPADAPRDFNTNETPSAVPPGAGRSQAKKMDTSQQTPTQVNEDRDYDEFCNPSSPPMADTLRSLDEPRTLQADDTGAVNFGDLSEMARPSSQVSEDAGFENTRGDWRAPDRTSQRHSGHGYTPYKPGDLPPETPALPKNPFGAKQEISAPFAGSQLFGQTPLLTSAAKIISPTSSRPSPNLFYNSISPNIMETSPLKNRTNVSSPTDIHTSSPPRFRDVPATVMRKRISPIPEETPCESRYPRGDMVPESPTIQALKLNESRQPLAHYEPMKRSQERKAVVEVPPMNLAIDSDSDDAIIRAERRKRIERKKLQAHQEMEKVSCTRPARRDSGEGPGRKRRKQASNVEEEEIQGSEAAHLDQNRSGKPNPVPRGSQKGLMQSLEAPSAESTKATPGEDAAEASHGGRNESTKDGSKETTDEEMIPATSPVRSMSVGNRGIVSASEPELPGLLEDKSGEGRDDENDMETSSLPPLRWQRTYGKRKQIQRRMMMISSEPATEPANKATDVSADPTSTASVAVSHVVNQDLAQQAENETITPASSPPRSRSASAAPMVTRSRARERTPLTPRRPRMASRAVHTSSSLTVLSTTPIPSNKTTPDTQASPESDRPTSTSLPSPVINKNPKNRALRQVSKGKSPQALTKAKKMAMRATRVGSESTDELQQSPPSSALMTSMTRSKSHRTFRQSIGPTYRGHGLFGGMAFAISMQSDKGKQQKRSKLEEKIEAAGGLILSDGFQELFEPSPVLSTSSQLTDEEDPLKLARSSLDCGFTALIADGHSRKVKYMQALALGLPCIAHQWITACLNKGAIVDWEPYLLAAGSSAVLGDAVRSRCLKPYPAADARLADVIDQRPRLLADQRMLAVVDLKKAQSKEKKPYIFLAQALGTSIHRVSTMQQAREALKSHEKTGEPFGWLYMDESIGTVESVLSIAEPTGRKRKRSSTTAASIVKNIRVLRDELVIQSLILGRIVEEDEMSF